MILRSRRPPRRPVPVSASIYWSQDAGAHVVLGEIRDEYLRRGAQESDSATRSLMNAVTPTGADESATLNTDLSSGIPRRARRPDQAKREYQMVTQYFRRTNVQRINLGKVQWLP